MTIDFVMDQRLQSELSDSDQQSNMSMLNGLSNIQPEKNAYLYVK